MQIQEKSSFNNVLFSAKESKLAKKELTELINQKETQVEDLSKDAKDGVKVVFENEGRMLSLNLSEENFNALKKSFGSYTNYIPRDNGSIRLNGEAENFISGWFSTALKKDNLSINVAFDDSVKENLNSKDKESVWEKMRKMGKSDENLLDQNANAVQRLNLFVAKDINKDGIIEKNENQEPTLWEALNDLAKFFGAGENKGLTTPDDVIEEILSKNKEDEENLLEKAKKEGLSALSEEERARLELSHPEEVKKLENEELKENLSLDLKEQIQKGATKLLDKWV